MTLKNMPDVHVYAPSCPRSFDIRSNFLQPLRRLYTTTNQFSYIAMRRLLIYLNNVLLARGQT